MSNVLTTSQARSIITQLRILDRFALTVKQNEPVHGYYVEAMKVPDPERSLCSGARACAVGTLWIAAGVPVQTGPDHLDPSKTVITALKLSAWPGQRGEAFDAVEGLEDVYNLLNEVAREYADAHGIEIDYDEDGDPIDGTYEGDLEKLFEVGQVNGDVLFEVTESARERLYQKAGV